MDLVLHKIVASLCIGGAQCFPALYGVNTPSGEFVIEKMYSTHLRQEVIAFKRNGNKLLAIHRVWRGSPEQRRDLRLRSADPGDNLITNGCINVDDETFMQLWQLPNGTRFTID